MSGFAAGYDWFNVPGVAGAYKYGASIWWDSDGVVGRTEVEYENNTEINLKSNVLKSGTINSPNTGTLGSVVDEWDDGLFYEDVIGYDTIGPTQIVVGGWLGRNGVYTRYSHYVSNAIEGEAIPNPALISMFGENWNGARGAEEEYQINYGPIELWFQENPLGLL